MNINSIEYNKPTFYLDFINYNEIKSYNGIDNLIDTYQENINNIKKELHGLIMSRPSDIFSYNDDEGTILDQLNEKEEELIENLSYYTHILEDATLLKNYIDDYVIQYIDDEMFEEIKNYNGCKYNTKEDLVFEMVVHPDRYETFEKFNGNIVDPLVPKETTINKIKEHAIFNVNKHNYNICPTIQGKKENNNVKYIIYIRNNKNDFVPYINKNNKIMFDTYKEAKEEAERGLGIYYCEYITYDYIKNNKQYLFDINNSESFFEELMMNYNNININKKLSLFNKIIYNILNKYYKLDYSEDNALEIIDEKLHAFVNTRTMFKDSSDTKRYENLILPIKEYIISSSKKVLESTKEEYNKMFNDYLLASLKKDKNKQLNYELYINTMTFDEICNKATNIIKMEFISEFNIFNIFMNCVFENIMSGKDGIYKIKKITY